MSIKDQNLTAIILCGGKGERLRPLTNKTPKPMIKIKGQPILFYIIEQLKNQGIRKFKIATGYKSHIISNYLKKNHHELNITKNNSGNVQD